MNLGAEGDAERRLADVAKEKLTEILAGQALEIDRRGKDPAPARPARGWSGGEFDYLNEDTLSAAFKADCRFCHRAGLIRP